MAKKAVAANKDPERWYIYQHKETKGVQSSLELPEEKNKSDEYIVHGPYKNSKVIDEWIRIKKESQEKK